MDANDRPSCPRNAHIIDLSTEAFRQFAPLSVGRIDDVVVTPIGPAPTDRQKTFLDSAVFEHLGVLLTSKIPTILFAGTVLEVSGRVTTNDQYVLLYVLREGSLPVNTLVKVGKDRTFKGYVTLPNVSGEAVFVVASGNSFDTDKYATLSLISPNSLVYPKLPEKTRARITPKITYSSLSDPIIRLPQGVYGELEIRQGKRLYTITGKHLLLNNLPLSVGNAYVKIS